MASSAAYTRLEALLLFQCLHAYGVAPPVFGRVSDLLKKTPDVAAHPLFQPARLSPDALRSFYLDRLRRELDHEQASGGDGDSNTNTTTANGDNTPSAKRKRHSPSLPLAHESLQHQHLLPKLVEKLYASYRHDLTQQIRADEDRYEQLQRDIERIERGDCDDQLPGKSPRPAQTPLPPASPPDGARGGPVHAPTPDAAQQQQPASPSRKQQPSADPRHANSTPHHDQAPGPPRLQQQSQPPHSHSPYNGAPPQAPLHQSPHNSSHAVASAAASPAAPSPGPPFQPQSGPYGGSGGPQYGPPPGLPPHYLPQQGAGPHQQQRAQYPHPGQPPYAPLHAHTGQPPPQAGFMLPPFQVAPQDPSRVHHQSPTQQPYPPVSTPASTRQQPPRTNVHTPGASRPGLPPVHPLVIQARQSLSTPMGSRSPHSANDTPVSARSFWKRQSFQGTPGTPAGPRPEVEPLDDVPPLIKPTESPPRAKSQRKSRARAKERDKDSAKTTEHDAAPQDAVSDTKHRNNHDEDSLLEPEPRAGRSRRKAVQRRARPGSIASSRAGGSVRDRSRSRSVLSHTETVAGDNDSQAGNQIKSERGTSVDALEEETVDTPSHMSTRRRGPAVQAPPSTRRKRNAREASLEEPEDQFSTPGPPKTINAQRHFSRMCAPIMNDINSHKHASTFTTAVRAKDAEGYYDIIKRPTDLKSIQKAIALGAKQVAAAATDTPAGSPGGGGGGVELPNTLDHLPPKSIVNAAQLEKELMRMFVNAVMFNPGEDGVVEDAREMFKTVEQSVSNWRNVERSSGRTEVEDTPVAEEEEQPTASKRRKM